MDDCLAIAYSATPNGNYDRNRNKHLALNGEHFTHSSYKAIKTTK